MAGGRARPVEPAQRLDHRQQARAVLGETRASRGGSRAALGGEAHVAGLLGERGQAVRDAVRQRPRRLGDEARAAERARQPGRRRAQVVGVEQRLEACPREALDHAAHHVEARLHEAVGEQRAPLAEVDRDAVAPAHVLDEVAVDGEVTGEERDALGRRPALEAGADRASRRLHLAIAARRDDDADRAVGRRGRRPLGREHAAERRGEAAAAAAALHE